MAHGPNLVYDISILISLMHNGCDRHLEASVLYSLLLGSECVVQL